MANRIQRFGSARADLVAQLAEELNRRGAAFIRDFDRQEPRMIEIAREFVRIADKVKEMIEDTDKVATAGAVTAVAGLGVAALGLIAAPFTGGGSVVAAGGAIVAMVGGGVAITAKVVQFLQESGSAITLERLGNEFIRIARPLNEELKEIKVMAGQLQVEAVECYLKQKLRRVEDALVQVDDASGAIEEAMAFIRSLVQLVIKLLQKIITNTEEDELTDKVVKSGEQCWKIINRFREVKKNLQDVETHIAAIC